MAPVPSPSIDVLALDEALQRLARLDGATPGWSSFATSAGCRSRRRRRRCSCRPRRSSARGRWRARGCSASWRAPELRRTRSRLGRSRTAPSLVARRGAVHERGAPWRRRARSSTRRAAATAAEGRGGRAARRGRRRRGFLAEPGLAGSLLLGRRAGDDGGRDAGPVPHRRVAGRGGMGVVYLAEDTRLGRQVTLRSCIPQDRPTTRGRSVLVSRPRRGGPCAPERRHGAALEEIDGQLCIVSEYVPGRTARDRLDPGPLASPTRSTWRGRWRAASRPPTAGASSIAI